MPILKGWGRETGEKKVESVLFKKASGCELYLDLINHTKDRMNHLTALWENFERDRKEDDGALWGIYLLGTTLDDWAVAMQVAAERSDTVSFKGAWTGTSFPDDPTSLVAVDVEQESVMSIDISGAVLNCHFTAIDEIEFNMDPREVRDISHLEGIFAFMMALANALGKEAVIAGLHNQEYAYYRYRPGADGVEYVPPEQSPNLPPTLS